MLFFFGVSSRVQSGPPHKIFLKKSVPDHKPQHFQMILELLPCLSHPLTHPHKSFSLYKDLIPPSILGSSVRLLGMV